MERVADVTLLLVLLGIWVVAIIEFYCLVKYHDQREQKIKEESENMKVIGNRIVFEPGDKFTVEVAGATNEQAQSDQQPSAADAKKPGQVIKFNLKLVNKRATEVVIDSKINFVLANPDKNGFYYGSSNGAAYKGAYNREPYYVNGSNAHKAIKIPAGGEVIIPIQYSDVVKAVYCEGGSKLYASNLVCGLGGRSLVPESYVNSATWNESRGRSNVLLYVDGDSRVVVPSCLPSDIQFKEGETYELQIL